MRGVFSNANDNDLFLMIFPRMSLHCKLVPVQHREYAIGLLVSNWFGFSFTPLIWKPLHAVTPLTESARCDGIFLWKLHLIKVFRVNYHTVTYLLHVIIGVLQTYAQVFKDAVKM